MESWLSHIELCSFPSFRNKIPRESDPKLPFPKLPDHVLRFFEVQVSGLLSRPYEPAQLGKQPRNGLCTCLSSPLSAQSIELQNSNASSSCESFANASAPPPPSSMLVRETCKLSHSLTLCVRKDLKGASEQSNPGHTHQVYTAQTNEQRGLSSGSSYETGKEHEQ